MKVGDVIICNESRGYMITKGKEYTVTGFIGEHRVNWFTNSSLVQLIDDEGKTIRCHPYRFKLKEAQHETLDNS